MRDRRNCLLLPFSLPTLVLEGQVRRSVLDLLISIVDDTEGSVDKEVQMCSNNASNDRGSEGPSLSRRIEVAFAVSQAFDETLIKLARGLRLTTTHSVRPRIVARRRHAMPILFTPMAMARASSAGLYLDAYESVLSSILRVLSCPKSSSEESQHDSIQEHSHVGTTEESDSRYKGVERAGTASLGHGDDLEMLKKAWIPQKLEVLGECLKFTITITPRVLVDNISTSSEAGMTPDMYIYQHNKQF